LVYHAKCHIGAYVVSDFALQESFYYGLSDEELVHVHDYNFDHPGMMRIPKKFALVCQWLELCTDFAAAVLISDAFDTELLLSCMENLKHGKAVDIPNYNFKTYKSVASARKVLLFYTAVHNLLT
jgi:uridine kinase